jgi:hypothetical protein
VSHSERSNARQPVNIFGLWNAVAAAWSSARWVPVPVPVPVPGAGVRQAQEVVLGHATAVITLRS